MDLALDLEPSVAEGYTSKAQRSRVITEAWATEHLYCLNCGIERVVAHRPNRRVEDFLCPDCDRRTQLKASRGGHGRTVSNSAYEPKLEVILANRELQLRYSGRRVISIGLVRSSHDKDRRYPPSKSPP